MATNENTSSSRIPKKLQDNINSLLTTYPGGILVPTFGRIYNKVFHPEQFHYRKYGFSNIQEFAKAIPEVMSLQYCPKENDLKVCKSGTPLTEEDFDGLLKLDRRGFYSLKYSKKMENPNSVYQDIVDRFAPAGKVIEVDASERLIYIRLRDKKEVIKVLQLFAVDLGLKICVNKENASFEARADLSGKEVFTKGEKSVFIGNLPASVVKDDLNIYLKKYSPDAISVNQRGGNREIYTYAYVRFNEEKHENVQSMIDQLHGNYWEGKCLKCYEVKDKRKEKEKSKVNDNGKDVKVASSSLWWRK